MILKLINNKNTYSFEVEDLNNGEKLFYHFQIPTADIEDGNYKMVLLDGDEIVTEEQVCIGAYNPHAIQYSRGENVYINAPFDANLEDVKEVEITSIETTVLPSEGYDGIKAVEVNAQPIYDEGYNVGNAEGIEVGKAEQKALLEPITITENGTYENENGYSTIEVNVPDTNGSYDEGYTDGYAEGEAKGVENAGSIIAETARVLDITENGLYVSRYSEIPTPDVITGVYPDGTEFYNYAKLEGISYDSGFLISEDMEVEIWWKGDVSITDKNLFGSQVYNNNAIFKLRIPDTAYCFEGEIAMSQARYLDAESDRWYHFKISYADGLWVDGVKMGDFSANISGTPYNLYINSNWPDSFNGANGYFGMIKITTNGVENIIIPTADGFLNTNTSELLEVVQEGNYVFTDNTPQVAEGNLIKTVNVNVVPKIDVAKTGIKFSHSNFTTPPEWADFSNVTDFSYMFDSCNYLVDITSLDTPKATNMYHAFQNTNIIHFPSLNTSNVHNMDNMFADCSKLEEVDPIDTSNVTTMSSMFNNFSGVYPLRKLPEFDCIKVGNITQYFAYSGYQDKRPYLTDCGGWKNLKINWNDGYGLNHCPNLTYQSCINILNGLWDFRGNGDATTTRTLKVHQNFLDTVGDEISIGTNKGWIITA